MFSRATLRTDAVVFVILVILVHVSKEQKRFLFPGKLAGSFLNFLNLSHIFNFFAMCAPQVFHMPRSSHTSGGFRRIGLVPAVRALEYPDFVFVLSHYIALDILNASATSLSVSPASTSF